MCKARCSRNGGHRHIVGTKRRLPHPDRPDDRKSHAIVAIGQMWFRTIGALTAGHKALLGQGTPDNENFAP
jgi:hypothetical protein